MNAYKRHEDKDYIMPLAPSFGEHTINELSLMFRDKQINLDPGFQRNSVWTGSDRRRLVQSIVAGYPVPSVFLYQRDHNGSLIYDVIDGKQRLETIFMFTRLGRFKRDSFDVKLDLGNGFEKYDWKTISRRHRELAAAIRSYKIQTVEVTGDLAQIIDLFVSINSTGKRLTSGERRHARFYRSPFLKEAKRLVSKFERYILKHRILSPAQIDRMKGTELFAELLMSINQSGPINKKTSLDRAIGNDSINGNTLGKISREFAATIGFLRRMFPDLHQTRFRNSAEFYTLFMLVWEMNNSRLILNDVKRNRIASELLKKLSTGVDSLRNQLRKGTPGKPAQRVYQEYLLTVQGDTDSGATRERRRHILHELLWSLFDRKDGKRLFTAEQRRIIWNSDERKMCARCKKPLTWEDFTVDHIIAYARGGRTSLKNAQPMHKRCNSRKGSR